MAPLRGEAVIKFDFFLILKLEKYVYFPFFFKGRGANNLKTATISKFSTERNLSDQTC